MGYDLSMMMSEMICSVDCQRVAKELYADLIPTLNNCKWDGADHKAKAVLTNLENIIKGLSYLSKKGGMDKSVVQALKNAEKVMTKQKATQSVQAFGEGRVRLHLLSDYIKLENRPIQFSVLRCVNALIRGCNDRLERMEIRARLQLEPILQALSQQAKENASMSNIQYQIDLFEDGVDED